MQVVIENKQNLDFQPPQQQVGINTKSQQCQAKCQASSIEKKYVCSFEDCNDSFLYPYQLNNHLAQHAGKNKYGCNLCEKKFFSSKRLRKHKETHGVFSSYSCSICDMTFASQLSLKEHNISRRHLDRVLLKDRKYTCDLCQKPLATKQEKKYHYSRSHPKYKSYSCIACDKKFVTERGRKLHFEKIHNGKALAECKQKKTYKCDLCVATYPQATKLKQHHKDKHPNKKPYTCNFCDKSFYSKAIRDRHHKNKHPNEKPLKNYQTTLASNDKQNFYQDKNKYQTLELANQSLPSISSVKDINNTNSNQYLGEITQLDMTSIEETINEDNNQYQLSKWPDDCQLDIFSEENFINENDISDISGDIDDIKQMMGM